MDEDRQFLDHIQKLDSELAAQAGPESAEVGDLCDKYRSIKGTLTFLLPLIKRIPGFGKQVAAAIELLMGIADQLCPTGN